MRPALHKTLWIFVLVGSLLAGCSSASTPSPASSNLLPAEGSTPAPTASPAVPLPSSTLPIQSLPGIQNPSTPDPTQTPASTATPPSSRREIKAGLEASDPNTAQLASGEIQLVEFFAFW